MILCVVNGDDPWQAAVVRRTWTCEDALRRLYSMSKTIDMSNIFQNNANEINLIAAAETNVINDLQYILQTSYRKKFPTFITA